MAEKELTREEYLKLRAEREDFPGIVVVGGHVISDRFGEKYYGRPMSDDELPIELQTANIDFPEDEDLEATEDAKKKPVVKPRR